MNNNIRKLGFFLFALFIVLVFYLSYLQFIKGPELATHPNNRRMSEALSDIRRGSIYDRNGQLLAETRWADNRRERYYPRAAETAHVIGYVSDKYGNNGLEAAYANHLLGQTADGKVNNLLRKLTGKEQVGDDLVLTIDAELQHLAFTLLSQTGKNGSIVLIDPRTGAILAAVSVPSYDPNNLDEQWEQLANNQQAPLINRAFQGAYPPGSIMKVVTAGGGLAANINVNDTLNCPGYLEVSGFKLQDRVHGSVNFTKAMAVSCNTYFARMGLNLGKDKFIQNAEAFGFNQKFDLPLETRASTISQDKSFDEVELANAAIGQAELLVSPLHMAMVAACIANEGKMMKPYLVEQILNPNKETVWQSNPEVMKEVISPEIAAMIGQAMVAVVEQGTGGGAAIDGIQVAGKTGTAENIEKKEPHAWFIGYAPANNPQVALAVIVENGGYGGEVAAPIARQMILEALR